MESHDEIFDALATNQSNLKIDNRLSRNCWWQETTMIWKTNFARFQDKTSVQGAVVGSRIENISELPVDRIQVQRFESMLLIEYR